MWDGELKLLLGVCSLSLLNPSSSDASHPIFHLRSKLWCPVPFSLLNAQALCCSCAYDLGSPWDRNFYGAGRRGTVCLCRLEWPQPFHSSLPSFLGEISMLQVAISAAGIETFLEAPADVQPISPQAVGILHSSAELSGPGPWAAQSDGLPSPSPSEPRSG